MGIDEKMLKELAKQLSKRFNRSFTPQEAWEYIHSEENTKESDNVHAELVKWVNKVNAMMIESASNPALQPIKVNILLDLFNDIDKLFKKRMPKDVYKSGRELTKSFYKSINAKKKETTIEEAQRRLYE
jgi:hypothetical protein